MAAPQLLRAYGITAVQVSPDADVLTMRPGLSSLTRMQLLYGATKFGPPGGNSPCPPSYCLANPRIQEISALPSGTSAPNTVIIEHAVRQFHLTTTTAGWLIQTPDSPTAGQISAAQHAAAAAGLTVETRNNIPTSADILGVATVFGILLALGILAMWVAATVVGLALAGSLAGREPLHGGNTLLGGHGQRAPWRAPWPAGRSRAPDRKRRSRIHPVARHGQ